MDGDLIDDVIVKAGTLELQVMHTPGHTPGSVSFVVEAGGGGTAFTGDTLFRRESGAPTSGQATPIRFSNRCGPGFVLIRRYQVVAGHGAKSTIGEERRSNPYLRSA